MLEGRHFDDDVMAYGFHDMAPRLQIKDGGTYGIPYRALCVAGIDNLLAAGMMITSDHNAHMSTRNTVSCMGRARPRARPPRSPRPRDATSAPCLTPSYDRRLRRTTSISNKERLCWLTR